MTKYNLGDVVTAIRNAVSLKSPVVEIKKTRITKDFARILCREGFIDEVLEFSSPTQKKTIFLLLRIKYTGLARLPRINNINCLSRPSLRLYERYHKIPQILGGLGLIILSTSRGLLTDREANHYKLGGELLVSVV